MRLFIAINLDDNTKQRITGIQNKLQKYAVSGNFTRAENMHLTLVFLGEIETHKAEKIKKILNETQIPKFEINFNKIGIYKRDGSDIWWIGGEYCADLYMLQQKLCSELEKEGFYIEKRKYSPHITLARQVKTKKEFDKTEIEERITVNANNISLMKSERINKVLKYQEIHIIKLI